MKNLNELPLTNVDCQFLDAVGIETPATIHGDFKCALCGAVFREDVYFLILPDGRAICEDHAGPRPVPGSDRLAIKHSDRVFLYEARIFLHICGWRRLLLEGESTARIGRGQGEFRNLGWLCSTASSLCLPSRPEIAENSNCEERERPVE